MSQSNTITSPVKANRTADAIILEAIEAYRFCGPTGFAIMATEIAEGEWRAIGRKLVSFGCPALGKGVDKKLRLRDFARQAAEGSPVHIPMPNPKPAWLLADETLCFLVNLTLQLAATEKNPEDYKTWYSVMVPGQREEFAEFDRRFNCGCEETLEDRWKTFVEMCVNGRPVSFLEPIKPISGGAPLVEEVVAERLQAVEAVFTAITMTRDERIDQHARAFAARIAQAVVAIRGEAAPYSETPACVWARMTRMEQDCFNRFLELMGMTREYWDQDECFEGDYSRFNRFVEMCATGSAVTFPVPPLPDDDRDRMAELFHATTSKETNDGYASVLGNNAESDRNPAQRAAGSDRSVSESPGIDRSDRLHDREIPSQRSARLHGRDLGDVQADRSERGEVRDSTIVIAGTTYGLTVLADGFDLCRASGDCHRVTVGEGEPSCDCPSFYWRESECKHIKAMRNAGLIPPIQISEKAHRLDMILSL